MIIVLLLVKLVAALAMASLVAWLFNRPVNGILARVVPEDLSYAWARYMRFAIYVVGVGAGVNIWTVEKYLPQGPGSQVVTLTSERWAIELFDALLNGLQAMAIVLLVFFVFALIAVVLVQAFEKRAAPPRPRRK